MAGSARKVRSERLRGVYIDGTPKTSVTSYNSLVSSVGGEPPREGEGAAAGEVLSLSGIKGIRTQTGVVGGRATPFADAAVANAELGTHLLQFGRHNGGQFRQATRRGAGCADSN